MTAIQEAIDRAFGNEGYSSEWEPTGDAQLLATEVKRLQDLHRPRDTRKGEWPEEGDRIFRWSVTVNDWIYEVHTGEDWEEDSGMSWLPAPPRPEVEA